MTAPETATRFDGLANLYDRYRPDYPDAALDFIRDHCGFARGRCAADVGCGTGISTRQMAQRGWYVIGIEPNAQMRAVAASVPPPVGVPTLEIRDGKADATGLPDGSADLVLAAQAFHWFEPNAALAEFHRILKTDGWVALMWNDQDPGDPFTASFRNAIGTFSPDPAIALQVQSATGEPLLTSPLFRNGRRVTFPHFQMMDIDGMLGRAFSASFAPKEAEPRRLLTEALREAFGRYQSEGEVALRFRTTIYVAQRVE